MINNILKSINQFDDPRFARVLWRSIGFAILFFICSYIIILSLLGFFGVAELIASSLGGADWVNTVMPWGTLIVMMGLSVFLVLPIISAITSLFLGEIAAAVEGRHYPNDPPRHQNSIWAAMRDMVGFFGVLILANIIVLIFWLITPFFAPFIYYAVNGYLLGREFFLMVASRHMARAGCKGLFGKHSLQIWLTGGVMAVFMTVPILNLLVPILAAAVFTHLFHQLRASD